MRKIRSVGLTLAVVLALAAGNGVAATLNVPSASYPTIQSAIDGAVDGDEVVVGDGIYTGAGNTRLDFLGKDITVRSANGAASTVIDCADEAGCWGVRFVGDETAAVFAGFTVTRATASAIVIEGTTAKSPRIVDCVLSYNRAAPSILAAGIIISGASSATITGCTFVRNRGDAGGGLVVFEKQGSSLPSAFVSKCTFLGNRGREGSGAITIGRSGGAEINDCRFEGNIGGHGGAIYSPDVVPATVRRSIFVGNKAIRNGGAIRGDSLTIHDSLFVENSAGNYGGGVYISNSSVTNCTLSDNHAYLGGGAAFLGAGSHFYNSIVWGNTANYGASLHVGSGPATIGSCDLEGGLASVSGVTPATDGQIIDADPRFALPGDHHLLQTSPCIDAGRDSHRGGLPDIDLDGRPRTFGVVDIGAYEFGISAPDSFGVVWPASLTFEAVENGTRPDPQIVSIRNSGYGSLTWAIRTSAPWLSAEPASGESTGEVDSVNVSVDSDTLSRGVYTGSIEVSTAGVLRTVPVTLVVAGTLRVCLPAGTCAYGAIQDAIDHAEDGDVVLVADGTYLGERNRNLNMRGKAITVRSENGPQLAIIDCEASGRGFVIESGESEESVVQGLTISNGVPPSGDWYGGGIYVIDSSPRIIGCRLENNHADTGAGLAIRSSGVYVSKCEFIQNSAGSSGAGAYVDGEQNTFSECTFSGNATALGGGGGLYLRGADLTIENCMFKDNRASSGGGVSIQYFQDRADADNRENVIRESRFEGNWAQSHGGGISSGDEYLSIKNTLFLGNRACSGSDCSLSASGVGGGAYLEQGSMAGCSLVGNQAGYRGGGLYTSSPTWRPPPVNPATTFNTIFWKNSAFGSDAPSGEDIYDVNNDVLLSHCAFDFNSTLVNKYGVSMRVEGVDLPPTSPPGFVDEAAGDFRLLRSSRCIDRGTTINNVFSDFRGSVRAVDGDIDGLARFDIGAYEYSEYFGGITEDQTSRAFKNLRINGSVLVTNHEYQVEWGDKEPFPSDRRISQAGEYEVRLALVDAVGLRMDLGTWKMQLSQAGYKIPVSFGQDHLGRWRIRLELVADPGQYALSDEIAIWYKTPQVRYLGEHIIPPPDADPSVKPDVQLESVVHWSADTNRLYAIAPALTVVTWYADAERTTPLPTVLYIVHPPTPQRHIAGTQRVDLLPSGTAFDGVDLMWTDGDATIAGNRFASSREGWSVLMYRDNEAADPVDKERFEVVRTLAWNHPSDPAFPNEAVWDIGQEIVDGEHDGEACGSGHVFFEAGPYDGHGESRAYDRETRQGPIFAVNDDDTAPGGSDFVVVWYQKSQVADGCWPFKPTHYDLRWPAAPGRIVIADQRGSGALDPGTYGALENMLIYDQPDPAFPGYNPNEEHASFFTAVDSELPAVYALRVDLNRTTAPPYTSEPYVLLKYREPLGGQWRFKVYRVEAESGPPDVLAYPATAGREIVPPYPLNQLAFGPCVQSATVSTVPDEVLRDKDGKFFAVQGERSVVMRYFYRLQPGFHFDRDGDGVQDASVGTCVPWLDTYAGTPGIPADVTYNVAWPEQTPTLLVGETLTDARTREGETVGLPNIKDQCVVDILYDEAGVRLVDPIVQHRTALARSAIAGIIRTEPADPLGSSRVLFVDLPFHLQSRLTYDAVEEELTLEGVYRTGVGDPLLLLNTITDRDLAVIGRIPGAPGNMAFLGAVHALKAAGDAGLAGASTLKETRMKALTAGDVHAASRWPYGTATNAYVTVAFNDDPDCGAPTTLSVLKVGCPLSAGEIKVIEPPNPFDEKVTLRHSGDFAGNSDARWFQWKYLPADFSGIPAGPDDPGVSWTEYDDVVAVPNPTTPPDELPPEQKATGELFYRGAVDVTIEGSAQKLLADTWFATRYYYPGVCGNPDPSQDAGNFSAWTRPQLYEGWVKRVMKNVNLFDQKVKDFHASEVDTLSSMIALAGKRYAGDVLLSDDPGYLRGVGLIELYETLLRRALGLTIDAGSNDPSRNKAILLAANRIAGLYLLLGNEAYADAADPTIGFSTADGLYGSEAPAVFSFQNQVASLLEEELALLRGRPDAGVPPFYNRLVWNFTIDDGEVAYRENYGITDQNQDGEINEQDAMIQFPQGHGDAWGHYLTAVKKYYQLITHDSFTWIPQSEAILVGQVPVSVDYRDERRFAEASAAKARAGSEIVGLTYRERYDEDPEKQWQGYRDEDRLRAWGVDDWAARAGQGSILDWVIGNALLPPDTPDDRQERAFSATSVPCQACAGQTRFELPPQFNHLSLQVAVDGAPQARGTYTVAGERDVVTGEWMTAVTFAAAPNATNRVSFQIDVAPEGIAKIDRTTVVELREIASHLGVVQAVLDQADAGLNPLGVAKEAVPFDIDPARVAVGETHFEQVYGRAVQAMNNAVAVFDHANQSSQMLRRQQDRLGDFRRNVVNAEADFNNRLIEIFGYPYADDCRVGGTYEAGYCETGPDLYHFMYVDPSELMGVTAPKAHTFTVTFKDIDIDERGALQETGREVLFHADTDSRFGLVKPEAWQGRRKAPGEIQLARSDLLQQRGRFESALLEYGNLLDGIEKQGDLIEAQHGLNRDELLILTRDLATQKSLNSSIMSWRARQLLFRKLGSWALNMSIAAAEALPTSAGLATDFTSAIRSAIRISGVVSSEVWTGVADAASMMELSHEQAKEIVSAETNIALTALRGGFAVRQELLQLENLVRSEATLRHELHVQWEGIVQAAMRYEAALARGERLITDRLRFRRQTAAQIQDYRYKDMTFRIFRNDALQKYRAQFDMASRYVYLAAKAYDYETTLLDSSGMAGQGFLARIVKQRTVGRIVDGQPLTGTGLADPMRRLWQNFQVLKPQLGFNNPQQETNRFSLRSEMFRILPLQDSNGAWRDALKSHRVGDLWQVPEFRRYCRPFAAEGIPEPGIVIPFRTTVTSRLNFFGWPLAAGDSYYSSSNFATKVRSVGVWFSNYNRAGLAQTPRIYLVPAGEDVLRSPTYNRGDIRTWHVVDQKLPVPFPINAPEMENDANWIPSMDTINDEPFQIRRHSDFKAYHDSGYLDKEEMTYDTRLIGRSVWNSRWLLIIPGASLLYDPDEGLDTFVDGPEVVGGGGERSGYGISDIRIFFETYGYSGN